MKNKYSENYESLGRFITFFHQIDTIKKLGGKNVLEIGVGNKTTSNYLKKNGFYIKTCDIDKSLNPDVISDIRDLPFEDNSFDVVCAFEILEHLPFEESIKGIKEMLRVSNKYVLFSVLYSSVYINISVNTNVLGGKRILFKDFVFRVPQFFRKAKFDGQHYWEIGRKGFSLKRVLKRLEKEGINVINKKRNKLTPRQHSFIIQKD